MRLYLVVPTVILLLGCASTEVPAQDASDAKPKPASAPASAGKDEAKQDRRRYWAQVLEKGAEERFELRQAMVFVPEVSLFGGGGGEKVKFLPVKLGRSREMKIPLARLAELTLGKEDVDNGTLEVTVKLRPLKDEQSEEEQEGVTLKGSIKANLELRGKYKKTGLETIVKLKQLVKIELAPGPDMDPEPQQKSK